jgi:phosphate transport system substrate-binding protein
MKIFSQLTGQAIGFLIGCLCLALTCSGCFPGKEPSRGRSVVQIAGSSSVLPLSEELALAFMQQRPEIAVNVAGGGSSAGIKAALEGSADIGSSSRELKPEEGPLQAMVIALDGIVMVVHPENPVLDLTLEQIKKIFTGEITNWRDVGGADSPINVISREEGSGTIQAFSEIVLRGGTLTDKAVILNSTGAIRTAVAINPNAIGYISLGSLGGGIRTLAVEGVAATASNVRNRTYPIFRPFLYLTRGEPIGPVKSFFDFVLSPAGQEIVAQGFIPVR